MLGLFLFPTSHVYATESIIDVSLPVTQEIELLTEESSEIDTIGIYELKSMDSNSIMPNGSKEKPYIFQINGVKKQVVLQFKYGQAGSYKYQLHQITQDKQKYIYDRKIYNLTVYIKDNENGNLTQQIILQNSNGEKCTEIRFKNKCQWKPVKSKKSIMQTKVVKTGDTSNIMLYCMVLLLSIIGIVLILIRRKSER